MRYKCIMKPKHTSAHSVHLRENGRLWDWKEDKNLFYYKLRRGEGWGSRYHNLILSKAWNVTTA